MRSVRIFVSCPSDVKDEKKALHGVVKDANDTWAELMGVHLVVRDWEHNTFSKFGIRPQQEVTRQIGAYDIYLGIMHARFGTPTGKSESGTKEEFEDAVEMYKKSSRLKPNISFFFKNAPVDLDDGKLSQAIQVLKFKREIEKQGISQSFTNVDEFTYLVNRTLFLSLKDLLARRATFRPQPIFLHFIDHYYLEMIGVKEPFRPSIIAEAVLACKIAYLFTGKLVTSAASFVESKLCQLVLGQLGRLADKDDTCIVLVGSGEHFKEYQDKATKQYKPNRYRKYKNTSIPTNFIFQKRRHSATDDIKRGWKLNCSNGHYDSEIEKLCVGDRSLFRKKFIAIPETLGRQAFIVDHVTKALYGNKRADEQQKVSLHRIINRLYFESIINEFQYGIMSDLEYLANTLQVDSEEMHSYRRWQRKLREGGLLDKIKDMNPEQMYLYRTDQEWKNFVENIHDHDEE